MVSSVEDLTEMPHKPVYHALAGSAVSNMPGLPFNMNHSLKMSTIGATATQAFQNQLGESNKSLNLAELRAKIAERMEYLKVDAVDLNDPKMRDEVQVPSYASSTDLMERNQMEGISPIGHLPPDPDQSYHEDVEQVDTEIPSPGGSPNMCDRVIGSNAGMDSSRMVLSNQGEGDADDLN